MTPPAGFQVARNVLTVFRHRLLILEALHLLPALRVGSTLGQADPVGAVETRPAPPALACGHLRRQIPQGRVLAQSADQDGALGVGGLDHGTLGVEAVDDEPQGPAAAAQLLGGPGDLRRGLVQLGVEVGAAVGVDLGQVGVADVQLGAQGQGQGVPVGVACHPGQGDPVVAVQEGAAGGAGGGVVVEAGALDARAVARRRRVVDGQQPVCARVDGAALDGPTTARRRC